MSIDNPPIHGVAGQAWATLLCRSEAPRVFLPADTSHIGVMINRIMSLCRGAGGALFVPAERLRSDSDDARTIGFVGRVSWDNGHTWEEPIEWLSRLDDTTGTFTRQSCPCATLRADGTIEVVNTLWNAYNDGSDPQLSIHVTPIAHPYRQENVGETTEITSLVVKQDDAGPPTVPANLQNGDKAWKWLILSRGLSLPNGDSIYLGCTRDDWQYPGPTADPSYAVALIHRASGDWEILNGPDVSAGDPVGTTNQYANETAGALNGSGDLVCLHRMHAGANENKLFKSVATGEGFAVWSDIADTGIVGNSCHPALASDPTNRDVMVMCFPAETQFRGGLTAYLSEDGGATWPYSCVLFEGRSGYSDVISTRPGEWLVIFEQSTDTATWAHSHQAIGQVRITTDQIKAGVPAPIDLLFNDYPQGVPCAAGSTILDWSSGNHAFGQPEWNYTDKGVRSNGTHAVVLSNLTGTVLGGPWDIRSGPATIELSYDAPAITGTGYLYSNYSGSGQGYELSIDGTTGVATATIATASGSVTLEAADCLGEHVLTLVRDAANTEARLYRDGVLADSGALAAAACRSGRWMILGGRGTGAGWNNPISAGVTFGRARFTRGVRAPAQMLSIHDAKPSLPYPLIPAGCTLFLDTRVAGRYFGTGPTNAYPNMPLPLRSGYGIASYHDPISQTRYTTPANSKFQAWQLSEDAAVGVYASLAAQNNGCSLVSNSSATTPTTAHDYVHNAATFTLLFTVRPKDGIKTGAAQCLVSNTGASNPGADWGGFRVVYNATTDRFELIVYQANGTRFNGALPATLDPSHWYLIAIDCQGVGTPVRMRYADLTASGNRPTALDSVNSATNMNVSFGARPSRYALTIGSYADNNNAPSDAGVQHLSFYGRIFDDAELLALHEAWSQFTLEVPLAEFTRMRDISHGALDQGVLSRAYNAVTRRPETALDHTTPGLLLWYRREGGTVVTHAPEALASDNAAHVDWGFRHLRDGVCRIDLPDAACATGSRGFAYGAWAPGLIFSAGYVPLIAPDSQHVNWGMPALPAGTPGQANGLPTVVSLGNTVASILDDTAMAVAAIDERLPAEPAAVGSAMTIDLAQERGDSTVGAALDAAEASATNTAVLNGPHFDGKSFVDAICITAAGVLGKLSGAGTDAEVFVGLDGVTVRAIVSPDESGNRLEVVYPEGEE